MMGVDWDRIKNRNPETIIREDVMKQKTLLTAALILLTIGGASAQTYFSSRESHQRANLSRVAKNYLVSLNSENEGVMEAGLAHVGRMMLYFPEMKFEDLEKKISELATNGPTPKIRYEAYLVSSVFTNPESYRAEGMKEYENPAALFTAVAARMQQTLLGPSVAVNQ